MARAGPRPHRVELHLRKRLLEIGEAFLHRDLGAAEAEPAPLGERVERRILQQLRRRPLDPAMRGLAEPGAELVDEPRLADAGFANDLHELAFAAAS